MREGSSQVFIANDRGRRNAGSGVVTIDKDYQPIKNSVISLFSPPHSMVQVKNKICLM